MSTNTSNIQFRNIANQPFGTQLAELILYYNGVILPIVQSALTTYENLQPDEFTSADFISETIIALQCNLAGQWDLREITHFEDDLIETLFGWDTESLATFKAKLRQLAPRSFLLSFL